MSRRQSVLTGSVALAGLAGLVAWLVWPTAADPPRERRYGSFTACLLTDDHGLAGAEARASWAGMQKASLATAAKVQYLSVVGEQSGQNAGSYFNSLALQHCQMIVAVGTGPVAATVAGRTRFPEIHYLIVGSSPDPALPAVEGTSPAAIASTVEAEMTAAVGLTSD